MDEVTQLRAENEAMKKTMLTWNETSERLRGTILEREQLLVRLWRGEKQARADLHWMVTDPYGPLHCVLDAMAQGNQV